MPDPLDTSRRLESGVGRLTDQVMLYLSGNVLRMIADALEALGGEDGITDRTQLRRTLLDSRQEQAQSCREFMIELPDLGDDRGGQVQCRLIKAAQGVAKHDAGRIRHAPQVRGRGHDRLRIGRRVQAQADARLLPAFSANAFEIDHDAGNSPRQPQVTGYELSRRDGLEGALINLARQFIDARRSHEDPFRERSIRLEERACGRADLLHDQAPQRQRPQPQVGQAAPAATPLAGPAVLETRLVAMATFVALPETLFHRLGAAKREYQRAITSPEFAVASADLQGHLRFEGALIARQEGDVTAERAALQHVLALSPPSIDMAQVRARLAELR